MKRFLAALTVSTAVLSFAPVPLVAQARQSSAPAQPAAPATVQYVEPSADAETLRERFREALNRYPRNVGRVLRMDPTLFNDPNYLAGYPAIAQFVAQHPEVTRNPEFYLEGYGSNYYENEPRDAASLAINAFKDFLNGLTIFLVIATITLGLLWLVRSIVDHRRWLRMTKTQTEVHSKLLDRFSSSDELLAYMKTPAGSRFLESAPISLDAGAPAQAVSAPLNRILWSVQAGVVLVLAGVALIFGRSQIDVEEVRQMLYLMGIFASFVGIGFILSALASYGLSRKLGLVGSGEPGTAPRSNAS
jgi:hypothetical protein